jgi:hypothetical protein
MQGGILKTRDVGAVEKAGVFPLFRLLAKPIDYTHLQTQVYDLLLIISDYFSALSVVIF